MINNHMDSEKDKPGQQQKSVPENTKPNESTGIYVRGFVKITDPESGKVYVETAN